MNDLLDLVKDCGEAGPEKGDVEAAIAEANGLKELGFDAAAEEIMRRATLKQKLNRIAEYKYVVITDGKIKAFLERKAKTVPVPAPKKASRFDRFMAKHVAADEILPWEGSATTAAGPFFNMPGTMIEGFAGALGRAARQQMDQSMFFSRGLWESGQTARKIGVSDGHGYMWTWNEVPVAEYKAVPPKDVLLKMADHKARGCFDSFTIASVEKIKDPLLLGRVDGVPDKRFFCCQWGDDISLDDVI